MSAPTYRLVAAPLVYLLLTDEGTLGFRWTLFIGFRAESESKRLFMSREDAVANAVSQLHPDLVSRMDVSP